MVRIIRKPGGSGGLRKNRRPLIVFCGTLRYLLPLIFAGFSAPHSLFQHLWTLALVDMSLTTHPLWIILSISVHSLSLYCFGMLCTDGQSQQMFSFSLSVFLSLLTFPFFWFYFWFPSSCCCYSFFVCFPQEGWIWPVILSEITLKTTGLKTTQFGLFWQPALGSYLFDPALGCQNNHFTHKESLLKGKYLLKNKIENSQKVK